MTEGRLYKSAEQGVTIYQGKLETCPMFKWLLQAVLLFSVIASFIAWIVMSDEWLDRQYISLIDAYQLVTVATLVFLAPLLAVRPLRKLTRPGFALVSTLLFFLCLCISLLTVYKLWGTVGVTLGILMAGVGEIPLAVFAAIIKGKWTMLAHVIFSLVGFTACLMVEYHAEKNWGEKTDMPGEAPAAVVEASSVSWVCLALAVPALVGMAISSSAGFIFASFGALTLAAIAIGIKKGLKVVFVAFLAINLYYLFAHDYPLFPVNLSGIFNGEPDAFINLLRATQNVLSFYSAALLLSPSALRWFWTKPQPPTLPA